MTKKKFSVAKFWPNFVLSVIYYLFISFRGERGGGACSLPSPLNPTQVYQLPFLLHTPEGLDPVFKPSGEERGGGCGGSRGKKNFLECSNKNMNFSFFQ